MSAGKRTPGLALVIVLASLVLTACSKRDGSAENDSTVEIGKESSVATTNTTTSTVKVADIQTTKATASVGFGTTPSLPPSNDKFVAEHFSGSGACDVCHNDLSDDNGRDVSIGTSWETSTMANAARDPYWRAKAAATIKNFPHLAHEVNDTCTRCHAPMANEAARRSNVEPEIFGDGFLNPANEFFDHAMDGVSCTLCHQIEDTGSLGTVASMSGNYVIAEVAAGDRENRPAYAQYTDPVGAYMVANAEFTPVYGAHMSESSTCGTCHDLKTPTVDSNGQIIPAVIEDRFPEQQTFTEWNNSDYRKGGANDASCQNCHMPVNQTTVALASSGTDIRRTGFSEHTFLGANTVMLDMFKNFREELGIEVTGFDQAIARNREFLKTSADLSIVGSRSEGNNLVTTLQIKNNTGHKLPSGYPSRRVFVHFVVTDENGAIVFESGRMNADGSIDGADGDDNFRDYEPHYNVITREDQVLIFESIMGDTNGQVTHSLIEAARHLKDNRLTPSGFDKNIVSSDVSVVGEALLDGNFNSGLDIFEYQVPVSGSGKYFIFADLVYQPLAYGHLEYLFRDTDIPEVDEFKTIYDSTTLLSETISSAVSEHNF